MVKIKGTDPLGAARAAAEQGIVIYPIGFGSPEGEPVPERGNGATGGFKRDANGQIVMSKLDEGTLLEMPPLPAVNITAQWPMGVKSRRSRRRSRVWTRSNWRNVCWFSAWNDSKSRTAGVARPGG